MIESCNNISMNGGTGSGEGSLILEQIAVNYRKKCKFACSMYDSKRCPNMCIYNGVLSMNTMTGIADVVL